MASFIDLSYTIANEIPVHPYDEKIKLSQDKFLNKDEYNHSKLETGMHVGTHMDAPRHFLDSDVFLSDYSVDRFIGNGCLLDVRGHTVIEMKDQYESKVAKNDIVLLYTGFDAEFGNEKYYAEHPVMSRELASFLIEKEIKLIGMDTPSPDMYPFNIHKMLFRADILIIENLRNLNQLLYAKKFEVIALPLKVKAEGSPIRAIARVL